MSRRRVLDYFAQTLQLTGDVDLSLKAAAAYAAMEVESGMRESDPLSAARDLGLDPRRFESVYFGDSALARRETIYKVIIDEPGDLADIPDSKCIKAHLPKDRRPTLPEIQHALERCRERQR